MSLPTSATLTARLTPFIERLKRYFWLWPPTAFVIGLLGFFLVNRQQWLGAVLALGQAHDVELPITQAVAAVISGHLRVDELGALLLARKRKHEGPAD